MVNYLAKPNTPECIQKLEHYVRMLGFISRPRQYAASIQLMMEVKLNE
jgi:hypothetical protein